MSLRSKLSSLTTRSRNPPKSASDDITSGDLSSSEVIVASQIWMHLQRSLVKRSSAPLQPFVAPIVPTTIGSDDLLAEIEQQGHQNGIDPQDSVTSNFPLPGDPRSINEPLLLHRPSLPPVCSNEGTPAAHILKSACEYNHDTVVVEDELLHEVPTVSITSRLSLVGVQ